MDNNSILDATKKVLGLDSDYSAFDTDVLLLINSAFSELKQLGAGDDNGFWIEDNTTLWWQFTQNVVLLGLIKQYIFQKVRLAFDPPQSGYGISAIERQIDDLTFRINVEAEHDNPPSDPFTGATVAQEEDDDEMRFVYTVETMDLAWAPTVVPDAGVANTFYLTLSGDTMIAPPVNGVDGHHITLELISNGHNVTWAPGWNFGAAGPPSLSGGGLTDIVSAVYKRSVQQWRAGASTGF